MIMITVITYLVKSSQHMLPPDFSKSPRRTCKNVEPRGRHTPLLRPDSKSGNTQNYATIFLGQNRLTRLPTMYNQLHHLVRLPCCESP